MNPIGSVVIPAHNEALTIERGLDALTRDAALGELEIVVAANGCIDDTAGIARAFRYPVRVIEVAEASKTSALNAGDAVASTFPRLYLDADVEITTAAVRALFGALEHDDALAVRPPVSFRSEQSSWAVKKYYEARVELPGAVHRISGGGAYALSELGRMRFERFPDVVADDLFVERLFASGEWGVVATDPVAVQVPRRLPALLAILRRTYRGNAQQAASSPAGSSSTRGDLVRLARRTDKRSAAIVYAGLAIAGRLRARAAEIDGVWERDETTRSAARSRVCGIDFDRVTPLEAVEAVERLVASGVRHHVVTANVDHVVLLERDAAFREVYAGASLILADGAPIAALARLERRPLPGRVTGADLLSPLLERAAERGWRVFALGGRPGAIERAQARAAIEIPGLRLEGHCPPVGFERDRGELEHAFACVAAAPPDLLVVALGSPKQELFWSEHAHRLPPCVAVHSGAALDFYAGLQRRAPGRMQRAGLEWLFRAATEPRLLTRYFGRDLRFFRIAASDLVGRVPPLPRNHARQPPR